MTAIQTHKLNILQTRVALNIETGELIDIDNPDLPVSLRLDALATAVKEMEALEEAYKERVKHWQAKITSVQLEQERARGQMLAILQYEGVSKIKGDEFTVYTQTRTKHDYDIDRIPLAHKEATVTIKANASHAQMIAEQYREYVQDVKYSVPKENLHTLTELGFVTERETTSLCIR
jgi:hypothetical protein